MKLRFIRTPYRAVLLCGAALLQSLATPVLAQGTASELRAVLRGGRAETINASDLTPEWRRFIATPQMDLRDFMPRSSAALEDTPYYTRGDIVTAGAESFLIAYRQASSRLTREAPYGRDLNEDADGMAGRAARDEKMQLRPGDVLTLSLLNVRTMGDLHQIRAFDPKRDLWDEESAKLKEKENAPMASATQLKQIGLGLMQYVQDYDEKFPPMRSVQSKAEIKTDWHDASPQGLTTVQQALQPYVKSADIFVHPVTHEIYRPNIAVSGVLLSDITEPGRIVMFWEKSPDPDGTRAVLYADGHVKREPEANWPAILAQSNRLLPPKIWKPVPPRPPRPVPKR